MRLLKGCVSYTREGDWSVEYGIDTFIHGCKATKHTIFAAMKMITLQIESLVNVINTLLALGCKG